MIKRHFVALGANLPGFDGAGPRAACEHALQTIALLHYVSAITRSRWYSTGPLPPSSQPRYINGIARIDAAVTPEILLADLQRMEGAAGRVRGQANAARVLDLDIIDMGGLLRDAPDPVLPHPRAHLRAFVLLPLRDVAPDWVHPRLGLGIDQMLAGLGTQDIKLL